MKKIRRKLQFASILITTSLALLLGGSGAYSADTCQLDGFLDGSTNTIDDILVDAIPGQCNQQNIVAYLQLLNDLCPGYSPVLFSPDPSFTSPVGSTAATGQLTSPDNSRTIYVSFHIVVSDNMTPVLQGCPQNAQFLPDNASGVTVDYALPTATDVCPVTVACKPEPNSSFPIGITTVSCSASDGLLSTSCSFSVTVFSPLEIEQQVLQELLRLKPTIRVRSDLTKVVGAISALTQVVDMKGWTNGSHPRVLRGNKVFNQTAVAVQRLAELQDKNASGISADVLQSMISRLLKATRILAEIAINDAQAGGGNPDFITKARTELSNGDADATAGNLVRAIEHYRHAWRFGVGGYLIVAFRDALDSFFDPVECPQDWNCHDH